MDVEPLLNICLHINTSARSPTLNAKDSKKETQIWLCLRTACGHIQYTAALRMQVHPPSSNPTRDFLEGSKQVIVMTTL